jgi:Ca2+/H+ antiporter
MAVRNGRSTGREGVVLVAAYSVVVVGFLFAGNR